MIDELFKQDKSFDKVAVIGNFHGLLDKRNDDKCTRIEQLFVNVKTVIADFFY